MLKKTFHLIFFICIIWGITYVFVPSSAITSCNNKDFSDFKKFKSNIQDELINAVDYNVENFVDDLMGFKMLLNAALLRKDRYIEQLWDKHFNYTLQQTIDSRVSILVEDIWNNHIELMKKIANDSGKMAPEGFSRDIRNDILNSFKANGISLSIDSSTKAIVGKVAAIGAGVAAGMIISKACKSNIFTILASIAIEEGASYVVEKKVKSDLVKQLKINLESSIKKVLSQEGGLFSLLSNSISDFHKKRDKTLKNNFKM